MNIDFSQDPKFSTYVILLMFSGLAMLIASSAAKDRTRWWDLLFGAGFLGYGFYLAFIFDGGSYQIFFYAFVLPVVMIVRTIKERNEAKKQPVVATTTPAATAAPATAEDAPAE